MDVFALYWIDMTYRSSTETCGMLIMVRERVTLMKMWNNCVVVRLQPAVRLDMGYCSCLLKMPRVVSLGYHTGYRKSFWWWAALYIVCVANKRCLAIKKIKVNVATICQSTHEGIRNIEEGIVIIQLPPLEPAQVPWYEVYSRYLIL